MGERGGGVARAARRERPDELTCRSIQGHDSASIRADIDDAPVDGRRGEEEIAWQRVAPPQLPCRGIKGGGRMGVEPTCSEGCANVEDAVHERWGVVGMPTEQGAPAQP